MNSEKKYVWASQFIEKYIDLIDSCQQTKFIQKLNDSTQLIIHISDTYRMLEESRVDIIKDIKLIPPYYLYNNYDRKELHIPEYAHIIGASAYENNSLLETIYIPKTIHSFDYQCFAKCPNLSDIYIDRTFEDWKQSTNVSDYWLNYNKQQIKLHFTDLEVNWKYGLQYGK